jgi:probable HAF family extracellular repeat protein
LPGGVTESAAYGVSADGSVVVGGGASASGPQAYRWTSATGMVGLGYLPGGSSFSSSEDVSPDGAIIVGASNSASGLQAFRWTSGGGMVGLGDLSGGPFGSVAIGVSADGAVVVGIGNLNEASGTSEAFRWTSGSGMVGLGDLPGGVFSSGTWDVSADGSVVVGLGNSALGEEAAVWTNAGGLQNVRDVLIAGGATGLTGWTLNQATGVSADGRTIVGFGRNPSGQTEAWIATIPEPSSLLLSACAAAAGVAALLRRVRRVVG